MKALVYTGPGTLKVLERRKPTVQRPTDAHVRLIHISICGTDLHILKGNVPCAKPGLILGHEGVGIVDSIGSAGQGLQVGDRVLISCMTSCGACQYCQSGISARCRTGGWALANTVDGTQAEYCNIQSGGSVVIIGAGPVGMAAHPTARLYTPSLIVTVDLNETRLETARRLDAYATVNSSAPDAQQTLSALTQGGGFYSVIEAVGIPATFAMCQELVDIGGRIANVGVHGTKVDLHVESLWDRNISKFLYGANCVETPINRHPYVTG